ncbi:helix-turn-helix domain-containing protein [Clostridium sp. SHJSY1]|uniref:GH39 family glycosyl hydrolase n=1 Tax=Clostridium sp. SHJSY1 TaxID=2942483 RepID=UPI00287689C7|nr:helix-turn-helix domain-containing protein [Clostridium sp. SHJSY1]MDS0527037.1 helix-turn-helix domain-containing protein [Clostridium sp. SHJSY1]
MEYNQKKLNFKISSSVDLSIYSIKKLERFWHQEIELIYVLSGSINVRCRNIEYNLYEDDIILINMFDIHTLSANDSEILSLKINISTLDSEIFHFSQNRFDCNSSIDLDKSKFIPIKQLLASLVKSNVNLDDNLEFINKSYIYKLLYILTTYFKIEDNHSNYINKSSEKIVSILNYVNDNFKNKISVDDLANSSYISKSYISKLFKKFIGLSFSEYLMEVRLSYGVKDLYNPNLKIEIIAEKNGFPNTRSFVAAFKNKYACLPSIFRKEINNSSFKEEKSHTMRINYLTLQHTNSFNKLVDYLKEDASIPEKNTNSTRVYEISPIDVLSKGTLLKHKFKKLICIGKAKHILISENRDMLNELQKDVGFEFIRFHGLLDDDMMLYSEDEKGKPQLSFNYIDLVIDYILSIKLKPFIELSFMPRELAEDPDRTMFFIHSIISLPKDMDKWTYMIEELIKHLIVRYGKKEVESWPVFLWNEPDVTDMFGFENRYDFFNFYKETYNAVKKINPSISFGSPPVFGSTLEGSNDWIDTFMNFCELNDCSPNFINTHFYPMELNGGDSTSISKDSHIEMSKSLKYVESENALKETIKSIKKRVKKNDWKTNKIFLASWNSSISHNELLNDTVYKAAYTAKNILENYDELESFGYWQISDFTDEVKVKNKLYHGGQGLFTYNGIKKSHYYVFKMFNKLGDKLIEKKDGYFITTDGSSFQIILYNYQHYSKLYASGELFDMTFENRYAPFSNPHTMKVILPLTNITEGSYQLTETIVNERHGSSFDKWIELGGVDLETNEDIEYLKCASIPRIQKKTLFTEDNSLKIIAELKPHEVRLIEVKPINKLI